MPKDRLGDYKDELTNSVVFVMGPSTEGDHSYDHDEKTKQLVEELKKNLPDSAKFYAENAYKRPGEADELVSVLFEFDPKPAGGMVRLMMLDHPTVFEGKPGPDLKIKWFG